MTDRPAAPDASAPLLRLAGVNRVFEDGRITALKDINLMIGAGECAAVLGKSGSGKSTLIHVMGGCDTITSGEIYWRGEPVRDQRGWRGLRATQIGIIFQEFLLLPALTALENVEMALLANGIPGAEQRRRAAELLEQVGLSDRMEHLPGALSGGERQRVAIARSIANDPVLLLADEPTGALDTEMTSQIMDLFCELHRSGMTVVLVTHEPDVAGYAQRVVRFRDGRIVADEQQPERSHGR